MAARRLFSRDWNLAPTPSNSSSPALVCSRKALPASTTVSLEPTVHLFVPHVEQFCLVLVAAYCLYRACSKSHDNELSCFCSVDLYHDFREALPSHPTYSTPIGIHHIDGAVNEHDFRNGQIGAIADDPGNGRGRGRGR